MKSQRTSDKRFGGGLSEKMPEKTKQCRKEEQIDEDHDRRKKRRRRRKKHSRFAERSEKKLRPWLSVASTEAG